MLAQANVLEATEQDRFCSVLPMYHCFALTATVLAAMTAGACVCFPADRHGRTILETIQRERCTILTAVPTLFSVINRGATMCPPCGQDSSAAQASSRSCIWMFAAHSASTCCPL